MSIGKRLLDLARANVNALFNRTDADLEAFSDAELDAELRQRQARRDREEQARRERQAAERAARQRSAQQRSTSGATSGKGSAAAIESRRIAALYAQLETPIGADLETVKSNFRRLMRQHHPDLNGGSFEAQGAATEITKKLNAAYNELERRLARPPR